MSRFEEAFGDLWSLWADAYCVTTNGDWNARRRAVMGRGVALQAKQRFPEVDLLLGHLLRKNGNVVQEIGHWHPFSPASIKPPTILVAFPVKHHWYERADLDLIRQSAEQLMALVEQNKWGRVLLPRPGCGNGQRDWETEVKPVLEGILDERIVVVDR